MKRLFKVFATKRVPLLVYSDKDMEDPGNWDILSEFAKEEEENMPLSCKNDYEFIVDTFEVNEPLTGKLGEWDEKSLVYHDGEGDITLSDARIRLALDSLSRQIQESNHLSRAEAQKILFDTLHVIMEDM